MECAESGLGSEGIIGSELVIEMGEVEHSRRVGVGGRKRREERKTEGKEVELIVKKAAHLLSSQRLEGFAKIR